jgi:trimeric autotransporter adhesin
MGPTAQDFHAQFSLGHDDRRIATIDADGVALAGIQGLNLKLEEQLRRKEAEIAELRRQLEV